MLFLLFQLGDDRYALETKQIIEVLPLVRIKPMPRAPPGVAGLINYRGEPVPVMDLNKLALGDAAAQRLTTRIILVAYPSASGESRILGLIAERATETLRVEASDFLESGYAVKAAPYLGTVATESKRMIQKINVTELLPEPVRERLFLDAARATNLEPPDRVDQARLGASEMPGG